MLGYAVPDRPQSSIDKTHFAYKQLSGGKQEINTTTKVAHNLMQISNFEAKEKGYIIIYLSNESSKLTEVYFDDLMVTLNEHAVIQGDDYYPFGLAFNSFKRNTNTENKFLYNSKELQTETNWYDYGARMYDAEIGRWHVVDPLADFYLHLTPYNYVENKPISFIDPNGMFSTHTDSLGNVLAVYNDKDLGVYKHNDAKTKSDVDKKRKESKTKSGNGEKVGETDHWDEFRAHDNETGEILSSVIPGAKILFDQSWDNDIENLNAEARKMSAGEVAAESTPKGKFDIKSNSTLSPNGPGTGKLLNGKYATVRSAGNYLAGYNGATVSQYGFKVSWLQYINMAGSVHQGQWKGKSTVFGIIFNGQTYGPPPYFGEIPYAGRMIKEGFKRGGGRGL